LDLGIAATALHEWDEARRAWRAYGINICDGVGEVEMDAATACVRLDPGGRGEVVWAKESIQRGLSYSMCRYPTPDIDSMT
jgi:hypothetical protein